MRSVVGSLKYIVPIVILTLMLSACERPLQSDDSTVSETFTVTATEVVVAAPTSVTEDVIAEEPEDEPGIDESDAGESVVEEVETAVPEGNQAEGENITNETEVTPEAEPTVGTTVEATETPVFQEVVEEEATPEPDLEGESSAATEEEASEIEGEEGTNIEAGQEVSEASAGEDTALEPEDTTPSLPGTHTVQPSDNLYRIGLQYGVSWVSLAEYNNLYYPYYIYAGQVLQIPGGSNIEAQETDAEEAAGTPTNYLDYSVQFGDTLAKISQQFGVSSEVVIEVNGIINPNLIYAGQVLKIPTTTPESQESITHVVQWGETLYLISLRYGVQWLSIAEANGIQPPYVVYAGQTLVIPGG